MIAPRLNNQGGGAEAGAGGSGGGGEGRRRGGERGGVGQPRVGAHTNHTNTTQCCVAHTDPPPPTQTTQTQNSLSTFKIGLTAVELDQRSKHYV